VIAEWHIPHAVPRECVPRGEQHDQNSLAENDSKELA
jgi:hypothetical protein